MSNSLSQSITIATTPDELFTMLTTFDAITGWYEQWDNIEYADPSERLHVGAQFRLYRNGSRSHLSCTVMEVDAPRTLVWHEHTEHRSALRVTFTLETDATGGTVLTHSKRIIARLGS